MSLRKGTDVGERIQRLREAGWKKPAGAVYVGRPGIFGNPFAAKIPSGESGLATTTRQNLADEFRAWLTMPLVRRMTRNGWADVTYGGSDNYLGIPFSGRRVILDRIHELRGKDLMCWCPVSQPCHADVLLELANKEAPGDH